MVSAIVVKPNKVGPHPDHRTVTIATPSTPSTPSSYSINAAPSTLGAPSTFASPSTFYSRRSKLVRKLFSVRILLLSTFGFQVLFLCAITYGITTFSQTRLTQDLSGRILDNVVARVADITKNSFYLPVYALVGLHYMLPVDNMTYAELQPILWKLWLQSSGELEDIYWTNKDGACVGYYTTVARDVLYEMYANKSEGPHGYLFPVDPNGNGIGDRSNPVILENWNVTDYEWWHPADEQPEGKPVWSGVYKDPSFPDALYITTAVRIDHPVTNKSLGVIAIDVTNAGVRDALKSIHISDNAQLWVMETEGALVGSSDPTEQSYNPNGVERGVSMAQTSNIKMIRETSKRVLGKDDGSDYQFSYDLNGKKIKAYHKPIPDYGLNFILVVAYPESDFLGVVTQMKIIILSAFVMYLITNPLTQLGKQMDEISHGSFDGLAQQHPSRRTKLYEIHNLQGDFARMVNALRSFGRFVPIDIVRYLLRSNKEASVAMHQKDLTVMFSDIKNFTTKVEEMSPAQLSLMLADYLNTMCGVIADTHGTVDKFIGDAIMALWNVPTEVDDHVIHACNAGLDSLKALDELNKKWHTIGLPFLQCRIGIHTGRALVGNLGSQERLAFTAVGDNINLGARLEALNKKYGTSILVSGAVYERVKEQFLCRYLDVVVVVGKTAHTHIYELVARKDEATEAQIRICNAQADALSLFLAKKFDASIIVYSWLATELPEDVGIKMMLDRATQASKLGDALPEDWTGYLILDEK